MGCGSSASEQRPDPEVALRDYIDDSSDDSGAGKPTRAPNRPPALKGHNNEESEPGTTAGKTGEDLVLWSRHGGGSTSSASGVAAMRQSGTQDTGAVGNDGGSPEDIAIQGEAAADERRSSGRPSQEGERHSRSSKEGLRTKGNAEGEGSGVEGGPGRTGPGEPTETSTGNEVSAVTEKSGDGTLDSPAKGAVGTKRASGSARSHHSYECEEMGEGVTTATRSGGVKNAWDRAGPTGAFNGPPASVRSPQSAEDDMEAEELPEGTRTNTGGDSGAPGLHRQNSMPAPQDPQLWTQKKREFAPLAPLAGTSAPLAPIAPGNSGPLKPLGVTAHPDNGHDLTAMQPPAAGAFVTPVRRVA